MENVILIGFMGSGKTSVGKAIAEKIQLEFIDMDEAIVNEQGRTISSIFSEEGEEYFRNLETEFLIQCQTKKNIVLSTGGGIVTVEKNIELLKKIGKVVFLNTPYEQILNNVKGDTTRPLLQQENAEAVVLSLMQKREPAYFSAANMIIQTKNKSIVSIAEEICNLL